MTDENDKTQEQAQASEPAESTKTFTVKQPEQKTINVVGGVVIATLVAIVLAQAIGDNNELSSNQMRIPNGGPNGQFQGPPGMQGQQGPGMQGQQGQGMQGPQGQGAPGPGMGPQGQGGQQWRQDQNDDGGKTDEDDDNDDRGGTSQNNKQPTPNSRAS